MASRRTLRFASLDDAVADAEHLLAMGYDKAGCWDLAQCCFHMAEWMRFPMDGFPKAPAPIRLMLWMARNSIGPKLLRKYLADGMPAGKPTLPQTVPLSGGNDAAAVNGLKETVERVRTFAGPPLPSPLFGSMHRSTWVRLNCVHAAHHLSFLVPKS
ncbi:MAG TPA: DUF1569 domain-containing protein [Urbifossiella sp.]|jgi:hypothetical protein